MCEENFKILIWHNPPFLFSLNKKLKLLKLFPYLSEFIVTFTVMPVSRTLCEMEREGGRMNLIRINYETG